jgi:hypothetical protein
LTIGRNGDEERQGRLNDLVIEVDPASIKR